MTRLVIDQGFSRDLFLFSFDIDFPLEVDDEYWINPDSELAFKQPENKPSIISYFNCYLRLMQISSFAMRTIVRTFPVPRDPLMHLIPFLHT